MQHMQQQQQQQQLQRMLQPGQVLVRQMIPGMPQPVFRAVTVQPGQVIQHHNHLPPGVQRKISMFFSYNQLPWSYSVVNERISVGQSKWSREFWYLLFGHFDDFF